jgi:hypothetical protein
MTERADSPELARTINMLREIYWREYGRGWKAAIEGIKKGLEQLPAEISGPDISDREFQESINGMPADGETGGKSDG